MISEAYEKLNKEWKATCRVILGGEVGELDAYSAWLSSHMRTNRYVKSTLSGKEIALGEMPYSDKARWISFDEIDFTKKHEPLSINQVKDIDSLIEAVSERVCYAGNLVLGNTDFSEKSAHVVDSYYVYMSDEVFASKYVAYTTHCVYADRCFGSCGFSGSFGIGANTYLCNRTLEVSKVDNCSDTYFSHGLSGCSECIFCFNLKNKRHCIGNLALAPARYAQLKAKLLEDIREELKAKKRLPSLEEIAASAKPDYSDLKREVEIKPQKAGGDISPMENSFSKTCNLVLGRSIGKMDKLGNWLSREAATFIEAKSCISGQRLLVTGKYAWFKRFPKDRLITLEEVDQAGEKLSLSEAEAEKLQFSKAGRQISKIAYFCPVWQVGNNQNTVDCPTSMDSSNCFRCEINIGAKNCSHSFWPRDSDSVAGSFATMSSSHSLKCYFSRNLSRCFEVDASRNCTGVYFCHNCENVHDSMFCFNVKNLRYAIGNAEVGREEFMRIKGMLLARIASDLEKTGGCQMSVYNIARARKQ